MNIVNSIIMNVGILFIMMVPGVILKKCKLVPDGFGKGISNLVLYIAQPVLVFLAYVRPYDANILKNSAVVLLLSVIAHAIFSGITFLCYKKAPDKAKRMLRFATIFSNAAFMGIPLISAVLGAEATIYASVYNITFNMFLWSLGVYICTAHTDVDGDGIPDGLTKTKNEASLLKALYHPVTIAAALGIIAMCLNLSNTAPAVFGTDSLLGDSLDALRGLVAPLSMLVIGIRLADINFKGFFNDLYMYAALILRHIVLPIATVGIILLVRLLGVNVSDVAFTVSLILAATPAASSSTMFAEKFDCDAAYVSRLVAVSTLLSILTMPLILMLVSGAI